jgi:glyoxylase-like metal-dependent hydrolase (beta-lactamase superfamily II)
MRIETITVGGFAMNCYLVIDEESGEAIYIDPGAEAEHLIEKVSELGVTPKFIINTHCHIDHTAEVASVKNHFNIPFYIHKSELSLLDSLKDQGNFFGVDVLGIPEVTDYVDEGDTLNFGTKQITIFHTPGHSPGGISIKIDNSVFVGDCLFMDSIGRTDLPGGNYEQLIGSIKTKLLTLEDSTNVYPGHGPSTTIGRERLHNPFLQ